MYYKPMGDLPYISSEQGGGFINLSTELIYEYTIYYKRPIPIQELRAEEGGRRIIHHGFIINVRTTRYRFNIMKSQDLQQSADHCTFT